MARRLRTRTDDKLGTLAHADLRHHLAVAPRYRLAEGHDTVDSGTAHHLVQRRVEAQELSDEAFEVGEAVESFAGVSAKAASVATYTLGSSSGTAITSARSLA